jgi:DNA invertase Pin-like site-specific DNA recombinase
MTLERAILELQKGYPEEYRDFSNGISLSDSEIRRYIKESVDNAVKSVLNNNITYITTYIATGNFKVFVHVYLNENGSFNISVDVCKNYCNIDIDDVDIDVTLPSKRSFIRNSKI